jgi:hypothetical protein
MKSFNEIKESAVWKNTKSKIKYYDHNEIQTVYHRHSTHPHTVLYSEDGGYTWQSVGMDSGKWDILRWLFAFVELK